MIVRLRVRRFFCDQSQCRRRTYVEQVTGLTEPRLRTSPAARSAIRAVAVELGGRPGQRLCTKLRIHGRRTNLLRQLAAQPVPAQAPRILGIDEFAFRKGRTYGTVLVDVESSRPGVLHGPQTGASAGQEWMPQSSPPSCPISAPAAAHSESSADGAVSLALPAAAAAG